MTFVQIIEFRAADVTATRRIDEDWGRATEGKRTVFCDLDRPGCPAAAGLRSLVALSVLAVPPERCGQ
jgi:hypothetical protein